MRTVDPDDEGPVLARSCGRFKALGSDPVTHPFDQHGRLRLDDSNQIEVHDPCNSIDFGPYGRIQQWVFGTWSCLDKNLRRWS